MQKFCHSLNQATAGGRPVPFPWALFLPSSESYALKISQLFREALLTSRPLFFFFLASVIIFNLFLSPTDHVMRPHPPCSVEQQIVNCKGAVSIIHVGIETRHACSTLSLGPQKLHLHHCFSAQQNVKWTRVFCGWMLKRNTFTFAVPDYLTFLEQ